MYNESLKMRFIKDISSSLTVIQSYIILFNSLEKFEKDWNADVCTQPVDILRPALREVSGTKQSSRKHRIHMIRKYIQWCVNNNVPGANIEATKITVDDTGNMKRHSVSGPLQLQIYLNAICSPESSKQIDNVYRAFYWMAFGGMKEEDAFSVTAKDVDFRNMIIRSKNGDIPIYRESLAAFRNCVELDSFVYNHPNYTAAIVRRRVAGPSILRGFRATNDLKSMRVEMSRRSRAALKRGDTDKELGYLKIWFSGVYYRLYEAEIAGFEPDFTWIINQRITETKTNGSSYTENDKRKQLKYLLKKDYNSWKDTLL